jgi:hypothetical protein
MREPTDQPVRMPAGRLAYCIVIHAQLGCRFLNTRRNRPPHPTAPDNGRYAGPQWRMADSVPRRRRLPEGALHHQPDGSIRQSITTERHATFGQCIRERSCGAFRDGSPVPKGLMAPGGDGRHRGRVTVLWGHGVRGPDGTARPRGLRFQHGPLEPTAGSRGHRHQLGQPPTGFHGLQNVWTLAIEAIGHDIRQRQDACLGARAHPGAGSRRRGPNAEVLGDLARGPARRIGVGTPRRRHEERLSDERLARPRRLGGQHADLTGCDLPQPPTVLTSHTHRVLPLFDKPAFIHTHHPSGGAHLLRDQLLERPTAGRSGSSRAPPRCHPR